MQVVENPMVAGHGFEYRPARIVTKCACGCGREIAEGYEHIRYEGTWLYEYECLMNVVGAYWDEVVTE